MADTFSKRLETKYIISPQVRDKLTEIFLAYMDWDRYGKYTVSNLYYDTDNYDLIKESVEKPLYKEKLRMRLYGELDKQAPVFLEVKKKFKGVVYKRREALLYNEAQEFILTGGKSRRKSQVLDEISFFLSKNDVSAKVMICYDRMAFADKEEQGLRITFDSGIRFRQSALSFAAGSWGRDILGSGDTIMEIKANGALPLWLCTALSDNGVYPVSFSKYGRCYTQFIFKGCDVEEVYGSA